MDVVAADAAADPEGYYTIRLGESLDGGRYAVFSSIGKGMFSNVVRARDTHDALEPQREVAIKIIRAQETMYKAGLREVGVLNKLRAADPDDKRHFIRLERTFEHRGHLCLVFESLKYVIFRGPLSCSCLPPSLPFLHSRICVPFTFHAYG